VGNGWFSAEDSTSYRFIKIGGGSGAGVNISPVAFLVIQENNIKLLPVNYTSAIDKLLDYVPDLMDKVNCVVNRTMNEKQEELKRKYVKEQMQSIKNESSNIQNNKSRRKLNKDIQPSENEEFNEENEIEYDETD